MRGTLTRHVWQHDPSLYAPPRYRRACEYETFTPSPISDFRDHVSTDVQAVVSEAERAIDALNTSALPALAPLARLLLRTESIASSKVEGMQLDVRDLARAEVRIETGGNASPSALEILANVDAMDLAISRAAENHRITTADITQIHQTLMASAPNPGVAGKIRNEQNWIGGNNYNPCGADFVPPPPTQVEGLLSDLCQAIDEDYLSPLVQAAIVHAQFETIHPYLDGNGRTGRALIHIVLKRRGLAQNYVPPISVMLAKRKDAYIQGLTRFREGDIDAWLETFAVAAYQSATLAKSYLDHVESLQAHWAQLVQTRSKPRSDSVIWVLLACLPAYPVISLSVAIAATGRSKVTVNAALADLEESGVLLPLNTGSRSRTWEAQGLLDAIAGLEDGQPLSSD